MMHNDDPNSGAPSGNANDPASIQAALAAARAKRDNNAPASLSLQAALAKRDEEARLQVGLDEDESIAGAQPANTLSPEEQNEDADVSYEALADTLDGDEAEEGEVQSLNKEKAHEAVAAKAVNQEYRLHLVPLSFSIAENVALIPENTIVLKKDKKKGIIKAYTIKNGIVSKAITGLNLSAGEVEVLDFPEAGDDAIDIERAEFPELIDKVSLRAGLTTHRFGSASAFIFSVGCGITTVAALAPLMTIGPLFFVAAAILGTSTTVANWRMSRFDLPEIFMGGFNYLFKNKTKVKIDGIDHFVDEPISKVRAAALAIGIACSIAFGTAIAILTYSATIALPLSFGFLSAISGALPALGAAFAAVTLISLSVIMIKSMSDLAKSRTLTNSIKNIFSNIFYIDPVKDAGILGHTKRFGTWLVLGALSTAALFLTGLGAVFTMKSCMAGLNQALKFSNTAFEITVQVLGLAAQVPYTITTTLNPILQLFYRWKEKPAAANDQKFVPVVPEEEVDPDDLDEANNAVVNTLGAIASLINAVGNGLIALNGKKFDIRTDIGIGTLGAIANSFAATFGNTISNDIPAPLNEGINPLPEGQEQEAEVVGNTAHIFNRAGIQPVNDGNMHGATHVIDVADEAPVNNGNMHGDAHVIDVADEANDVAARPRDVLEAGRGFRCSVM